MNDELNTAKGNLTRNRIYMQAKKNFYTYGYKKTTLTKISKQLNISPGNLTYYFKTKDSIATQIIMDFRDEGYRFLDPYIDKSEKFFFKHYVFSFIYYHALLEDECTRRFYYEVQKQLKESTVIPPVFMFTYEKWIEEFNLNITPFHAKVLALADLGARRELTTNFIEGSLRMPIDDLVFYLLNNMAKLWEFPELEVLNTGFRAYQLYKKLDTSHLKIL